MNDSIGELYHKYIEIGHPELVSGSL